MARWGRRTAVAADGAAVLDEWPPSAVPGRASRPGTRSTPPGCQGAHLTSRRSASQLPAGGAVPLDRLGRVGAAGRVEAAPRRQGRADRPRVEAGWRPGARAADHGGTRTRVAEQPVEAGDEIAVQHARRRRSPASGRARTTRSAVGGQPVQLRRGRRRAAAGSRGGGPPSCRRPCRRRNRPAHRPAAHRAGRGAAARLLGPFGEVVEHHGRPPGAPAGPDDRGELRTPAQACLRGQHVRRRASRDPCADDRRGSPGPRGCASAAGSRGSWTDGGCSAGTCACSRGTPTTRHRRCAPTGGRARAGRPGRTATCRAPATPEAGHCGPARAPVPPARRAARAGWRPEPSTDSGQHNRGTRGGRRPGGCRPPMVHPGRRRARRAAAARREPTRPDRRPGALPGCGRGC